MSLPRAFFAAAMLLGATSGCGANCEVSGSDPVSYQEGTVDSTATVYETSPWYGRWLYFPAGRRYRLYHHLGKAPCCYDTYLAFHEYQTGDNFQAAESAGNQTVLEAVTDEFIQIHNDTCAEFYLRVTATAAPAGAISDAGTD